jgi:hypothetical protein
VIGILFLILVKVGQIAQTFAGVSFLEKEEKEKVASFIQEYKLRRLILNL